MYDVSHSTLTAIAAASAVKFPRKANSSASSSKRGNALCSSRSCTFSVPLSNVALAVEWAACTKTVRRGSEDYARSKNKDIIRPQAKETRKHVTPMAVWITTV